MSKLGVPSPRSQLFKVCEYRKCRKRFRVTPSEFKRRRFCCCTCAAYGAHGDSGGPRKRFALSKSGTPGICLVRDNPREPRSVSWSTYTLEDGRRRQKSFAIRRFGYAGAWRRAAKLRAMETGFKVPMKPPAAPGWLKKWAKRNCIELKCP